MTKVTNMFREFSIAHIEGYDSLSCSEKDLFITTYKKHLASMTLEEKINHSETQLKKIKIKKIETEVRLFKVLFTNDVYYYLPEYKWIKVT